jgi:site-specific DNA-methyltransferase (adenine-specific)
MRTANQLPELLTDRVMEIAGYCGGTVVDPFVGTGTSLVSAARKGMTIIGNDIASECISITKDRLDALEPSHLDTEEEST